jgi:pimeloyl-CoA synthetase
MYKPLQEHLTFNQANIVTEALDEGNGGKSLYMRGIFIEGDVRNQNNRIYPKDEIHRAVRAINEKIKKGYSVLGEADHPDDLNINLDRVSHVITEMDIDGPNGIGKLKILPTPMGNICKTLLESGVKLGVSSRGSGNVNESGHVKDFEIITVDIVANPSAPDAYPDPIYERIMNHRRGNVLMDVADAARYDKKAQRYLQEEVTNFITNLKYRRD